VDRLRSGGGRECPLEHRHTGDSHTAIGFLEAPQDIALGRRHPKRSVGRDGPGRSQDTERLDNTLAVFVPCPSLRRESLNVKKACLTPFFIYYLPLPLFTLCPLYLLYSRNTSRAAPVGETIPAIRALVPRGVLLQVTAPEQSDDRSRRLIGHHMLFMPIELFLLTTAF